MTFEVCVDSISCQKNISNLCNQYPFSINVLLYHFKILVEMWNLNRSGVTFDMKFVSLISDMC